MRLRTFTAPDMPAAMEQVRQALGEDAIILSSGPQRGGRGVQVTAAIEPEKTDQRPAAGSQKNTSLATDHQSLEAEQFRFDLQHLLRFHNVPELFIAKMLKQAGKHPSLDTFLAGYFAFEPLGDERILMLVGPPGVGKTLSIARLAATLRRDKQKKLAVITTDNQRAGGVEQLQAFTSILGLDLHIAPTRADLWRHIQSQAKGTRILVDTAGCNPYDAKEMNELAAYGALEGVEPVLALPAGGDSEEAIDIAEAFSALPIRRLLVTRADTARRFGGVLSVAAAHGLAFANASCSPGVTEPLQPMDGETLAQYLLRYQLQT